MKLDCLILGEYQTNCYIVRRSNASDECIVIDTGLEPGELIDFLERDKLNPLALILTHGHADHIAGVEVLRGKYPGIKVYIHKLDAEMLSDTQSNLSAMTGRPLGVKPADFNVDEPDIIEQAGIKLQVIHTPGHTQGGICLYSEDEGIIFTGDALFADSVGRTDFPGGSMMQLIAGIKGKICTLPDETQVYPGHGPSTTIGREKAHNQYLL